MDNEIKTYLYDINAAITAYWFHKYRAESPFK